MQENEFEKKLQQKMEELQVQPAGEVWEKIKEQVGQKKRRRRVVFFFLLAGLLVAGIIFSGQLNLFNKNEKELTAGNNTAEKQKLNEQIVEPGSASKTTAINPSAKQDNNSGSENSNSISQTQDDTKLNNDNSEKNTANSIVTTVAAKDELKKPVSLERKTKASVKTKIIHAAPGEEDGEKEMVAVQMPGDKKEELPVPVSPMNGEKTEEIKKPDAKEIVVVEKKEVQPNTEAPQPVNKTAEEKNKKKKWDLAINVSGGISAAGYNNTNKNVAFTADGLNSNPGTGVPTGNVTTYYPSEAKPGFAFTAGVQVYRRLSNAVKLTGGLQYQFHSTSQKTGGNITNNQVRTLSYGNGNTFHNRYHYLSLPVGLSVTLFNIGNKEVCAEAGVNFSRLLKTNALAFDTANGYYYNNQAMFNTTFVGLSASVAINLAGKNKPALYIGPQFYYNITRLAGEGMYGNTHSRYIGIMLRKNLWK